jgi:predicted flap endonuclease-1-like 5' DNA nuclease
MAWLIAEMWALLLAAFLLGAVSGAWAFARRRTAPNSTLPGREDYDGVASPATAPAHLLSGPDGAADDLTQIIGIDRATEQRLNALGVYHFRQIAAWDDGAARWIEIRLNEPGRVARERWTEQAAAIAAL